MIGALTWAAAWVTTVAPAARIQEDGAEVSGIVQALTMDRGGDRQSGGVVMVGASRVRIPPGLAIDLPSGTTTLADVFARAPLACRKRGESGIARSDACRQDEFFTGLGTTTAAARVETPGDGATDSGASNQQPEELAAPVAHAILVVTRTGDGGLVASAMRLTKNIDTLWGGVTFVNTLEGYFRINGTLREDDGGTLVRFNDPDGAQSDQHGIACGGEGNCSPDGRFRANTASWSLRFERGNPVCVGADAQGCPIGNRNLGADDLVSRIPIAVGDNVKADGAFEFVGGVRFFSAQTVLVQTALLSDR